MTYFYYQIQFVLISSFLLPVETIPHSDKIGQVGWKQLPLCTKGCRWECVGAGGRSRGRFPLFENQPCTKSDMTHLISDAVGLPFALLDLPPGYMRMVEMMGWGAGWVEEGSREREWNVPKSNLYRIKAKSCCIPLKKGGGYTSFQRILSPPSHFLCTPYLCLRPCISVFQYRGGEHLYMTKNSW